MAYELVKRVRLCEVGLRDGLQNEKSSFRQKKRSRWSMPCQRRASR